ncbi:MAG: hypothetical protein KIS92_02710 [Planctomycetota bacterium]|nr:hypothetical protein [Planctomycetota bacterium]
MVKETDGDAGETKKEDGQQGFAVMEFLRKKCRYGVVIKNFKGKYKKIKNTADSARTKMIDIEVDVPVTKAIKKRLDPAVAALIEAATGEGRTIELPLSSIDIAMEVPCIVRLWSKKNYNKDSRPKHVCGLGNGDSAVVRTKKVFIKDHQAYLRLLITTTGTEDLWAWGWNVFDESEIVIETEPLQKDLPFEGGDKPAEKDGDDDSDKEDDEA